MKNPTLWLAGSALIASSAFAAQATFDTTLAGWTPLVSAYGRGDTKVAVRSLDLATQAYETMLHHTEIDAPTQKFIDKSLDELEDFDLDGFHDLLPEKQDGFRALYIRGDLEAKRYVVQRANPGAGYEVSLRGPRNELGDMSAQIRARPHRAHGEHKSFLIGGRVGFGIGPLAWNALTDAGTDGLRLASTGDPRPGATEHPVASESARTQVKALNPGLGEEDVEVLALLYDAFPDVSKALGAVGRVDDVRVAPQPNATYQHLTAHVHVMPERLKKRYPVLAKHLGKLGDLARADIRWVDARGRTIMKMHTETKSLQLGLECYVKDGRVLPFTKEQVFEAEPIDPMSTAVDKSKMIVDARLEMLGVIIKLGQLRVDVSYAPQTTYASADVRVISVPNIKVEGRALGFLPTGFVDAFIPGNMESLTRDFFEVAAKGNDGKGVVAHVDIGSATQGGPGVVGASIDVEALDNFLVKMGVGIVNDRVIPSDDATADSKRLAAELHDAFIRDLSRFEKKVGG